MVVCHDFTGQAAVDASNVYHYLFYEGNVDIYSIDDPLKRNAIIGFINNFGQIPKQVSLDHNLDMLKYKVTR